MTVVTALSENKGPCIKVGVSGQVEISSSTIGEYTRVGLTLSVNRGTDLVVPCDHIIPTKDTCNVWRN
jgi:hypothetical protein